MWHLVLLLLNSVSKYVLTFIDLCIVDKSSWFIFVDHSILWYTFIKFPLPSVSKMVYYYMAHLHTIFEVVYTFSFNRMDLLKRMNQGSVLEGVWYSLSPICCRYSKFYSRSKGREKKKDDLRGWFERLPYSADVWFFHSVEDLHSANCHLD